MATKDVPGANPANKDELKALCWAEHEDGSLLFVKSVEGSRVIYEVFDVATDPITQYTDAMPEEGFKKEFTWDPTGKKKKKTNEKWTWHDKIGFPWDQVIKGGAKDGIHYASAEDQMSAAMRVALSLALKNKKDVDPEDYKHLLDAVGSRGQSIIEKLRGAIATLPIDDKKAKKQRKILEKAQKKIAAIK